jgi:F-type H+-transporting ATPase subunit delta
MSVKRIAARYAKSLLDLAIEQNVTQDILKDMTVFKNMAENRDLQLLLKSPIVNTLKKQEVFNALFTDKLSKMTNSFFSIALRKGRESHLVDIADSFIDLHKELKGISDVKLTTATALSDEALAKIKEELLKSTSTRQTVDITTKVDESIIGGFIIEIGDRLYDDSVAHKLEALKKSFATS